MNDMNQFHPAFAAGVIFLVTLGSFSADALAPIGWIGAIVLGVAWLVFAIRAWRGLSPKA